MLGGHDMPTKHFPLFLKIPVKNFRCKAAIPSTENNFPIWGYPKSGHYVLVVNHLISAAAIYPHK